MNNNYFIGAGTLALVGVILSLVAITHPVKVVPANTVDISALTQGIRDDLLSMNLGAQGQSLQDGDCIITPAGGHVCSLKMAFVPGTTTIASLKNGSATLTIVANQTWCSINTGTSSATIYALSKAATRYASTTVVGIYNIAASAKGFIPATTTVGAAVGGGSTPLPYQANLEVAPNAFLNWTVAGALSAADGVSVNSAPGLPSMGSCLITTAY